jgi:hypothetical protein
MRLLLLRLTVMKAKQPSNAAQLLAHICKAAAASASGGILMGSPPPKMHDAPLREKTRVLP